MNGWTIPQDNRIVHGEIKITEKPALVFQIMRKCTSVKLAAYSHSAADSPKTPSKKLESSPTTHVTETRFLHVLDSPDHFGTIYIFYDIFTFELSFFFNKFSRKKFESRVGSIFTFSSRFAKKS